MRGRGLCRSLGKFQYTVGIYMDFIRSIYAADISSVFELCPWNVDLKGSSATEIGEIGERTTDISHTQLENPEGNSSWGFLKMEVPPALIHL